MVVMADPTARTLRLLDLLQSAERRGVAELAERLGVDERTIRRDVQRLTAAGVRVESDRGRYGGYRLATGSRVLPIVFTAEETVAVFLGLAQARATAGDPPMSAQTAMAKVRRAMRDQDVARGESALRAIAGGATPGDGLPDPGVLLTLAEAVESRRVVDLRYQDRRGAPSRRDIHPHGLAANVGRWYLVATDADAGEDRTFRVDRIRTARARCTTFPARAEPVSEAGLTDRFADADYRWRVVLHVDASAARLRDHLPSSVARIEPLAAGPGEPDPDRRWHRAEIHAERLDWIPAVIADLGCEVVVETPDELRDLVRETADRMRRAAVPAEPR